jgi:hypothetical protein
MNALTKVRHLHLNSHFQVLKKLKIVMFRVITLTVFFITSKIPSLQIHQQEGYKGKGDVEETMILKPMIKAKVMTWPLFKTNLFN